MPVSYYCGVCRTSTPPASRTATERARDDHRDQVHAGLIPDGEEMRRAPQESFNGFRFARAIGIFLSLPILDWLWRHR